MNITFRALSLAILLEFPPLDLSAQWVQTSLDSGAISTMILNNGMLFAVGHGVFRSSDDGNTWSSEIVPLSHPESHPYITALTAHDTLLFSGVNEFLFEGMGGGVYTSSDNGSTWMPTSLDSVWVWCLFSRGSDLFVGASEGVFHSSDNGGTWDTKGLQDTSVYALGFAGSNILAGTNDGIFHSSDNGSAWIQTSLDSNTVTAFAMTGTDVFAGAHKPGFSDSKEAQGLFRSTDQGLTWVHAGLDSFVVSSLSVSGKNLIAGTEWDGAHAGTVFLSLDDGLTWKEIGSGLAVSSVTSIALDATTAFLGTDSGVWRRPFTQITGVVTVLDTVYTPVGYPEGDLTATIFIPPPSSARGIGIILGRYTNATRLTAKVWCDTLAARGYLAMTIDYGNLDTSYYPKPQRAFKTAVEFLRSNSERFGILTDTIVGFGQSQGALIWGQTMIWDNDDDFFGTDPFINDNLDGAVLLYGAYDMFNNLLTIQDNILTAHFSPDPSLRGTKGQCITNTGNINTPVLLVHGTSDAVVNIIHSRKLYDSLQVHGKEATLIELSGAPHVFDLASNGSFTNAGLIAKDSVLAFLEREFPIIPSVKRIAEAIPASFSLEQNYPNPFNPSTAIPFTIHRSLFTTLKIYDLLGREVTTLVNEHLNPGSYEVAWDASEFPSGTYFYRLQAGELAETKKLILLR